MPRIFIFQMIPTWCLQERFAKFSLRRSLEKRPGDFFKKLRDRTDVDTNQLAPASLNLMTDFG